MARVFLVHWHEEEARELASDLRLAGHDVDIHASEQAKVAFEASPDVVVISLLRLPSHGQQVAAWVWEAKKRQQIPIVFAGGAADKVAETRKKFGKARFCEMAHLEATLEELTPEEAAQVEADGEAPAASRKVAPRKAKKPSSRARRS